MNEKTIKLEASKLLASCLSRMLVDEIENQEQWKQEEIEKYGSDYWRSKTRENIINECEDMLSQLERQGIERHFKCN